VLILNFALLLMELSWNTIGIDPTGRFGITNEAIYPGTIFLTGIGLFSGFKMTKN
jgi:hypothetical protein